MEQERKIEKWLKAYAKKRRGQVGDSFTLDPATRRILQNEISRAAPASEDEDETMSLWELLRKHWLYLLGFAACVFVLAALFLPRIYAPTSGSLRASSTLSMAKNTRQIPASTQQPIGGATGSLTPPPPPLTPDNSLAHARAAQSESNEWATATTTADVPAARREFNGPATASETVPPASAAPMPAVSGPAVESHNAASQPSILSTTGLPATATGGSYAMNSMPVDSLKMRDFGGGAEALQGQASKKDFQGTAASPSQSAAVLMNFQVSQNGNTIRVVDQDGSIYTGTLELEGYEKNGTPGAISSRAAPEKLNDMAAQNATVQKTESPKAAQFDSLGDNVEKGNKASAANAQAPMEKYYFYAQGTNLTLKQTVVFAGTLLEDLSFASNTQQTFGMSANAALGAAYAQQFMRSVMTNQPLRIEGIAIIDQTYKIQINATSVSAKNNSPPK